MRPLSSLGDAFEWKYFLELLQEIKRNTRSQTVCNEFVLLLVTYQVQRMSELQMINSFHWI